MHKNITPTAKQQDSRAHRGAIENGDHFGSGVVHEVVKDVAREIAQFVQEVAQMLVSGEST